MTIHTYGIACSLLGAGVMKIVGNGASWTATFIAIAVIILGTAALTKLVKSP